MQRMRAGVVDVPRGASWVEGGRVVVLDIGRSVVVEHRAPAAYLGFYLPRSGSSPSARRPIGVFRLLAPALALYNDTVRVTILPGQIVETQGGAI